MPPPLSLHVITRAVLERGELPCADPDGFATMRPEKRRAVLANPLLRGPDEPMQVIGTAGDRAIGRLDLIAGEINVERARCPILFGSDFIVPPEHRQTLMGVRLLMQMHAMHHTLGAFGPSQQAAVLYEKLGWGDLRLQRYILLRRSRPVIERYLGRGPLPRAAGAVADAGLVVQRLLMRGVRVARCSGLTVTPADHMPPELDDRLDPPGPAARPHRSAAWVNWLLEHRFRDDPRSRARLLFVHRRGVAEPVAWLLLKVRFHEVATHRGLRDVLLGSIGDWGALGDAGPAPGALMLLGTAALLAEGVDAVEVCLPHDAASAAPLLRALGFIPVGAMRMMFRATAGSPLADDRYRRAESWRLRPADGEAFFA